MQTVIPVRPAVFENENRIAAFIANEDAVNKLIRQVPERRWSPSNGYWHFPKTEKHWAAFKELFKDFDLNIQAEPLFGTQRAIIFCRSPRQSPHQQTAFDP